jgi:hypothetical protein
MGEFHIDVVPARQPPTAVDGHIAERLGEPALTVLAGGPALVVGCGVGEAKLAGFHGYAPDR